MDLYNHRSFHKLYYIFHATFCFFTNKMNPKPCMISHYLNRLLDVLIQLIFFNANVQIKALTCCLLHCETLKPENAELNPALHIKNERK